MSSPQSIPTDAALLASLAERKEFALDALMKRYSEVLYRKCFSFLKDSQAAKDCVQDVFIGLWKHSAPQSIENLTNYLLQSARFGALDIIRKNKRKAAFDEDTTRLTELVLYGDGLDNLLLKELKEKLERVISSFPPAQQQVWRLNRDEGLTYKEIAEALGISQKTVEKKMSASLRSFRSQFGDELGEAFILIMISRLF